MSADPFFVATFRIRELPSAGSQTRSARTNRKSFKTGLTRRRRPYMSNLFFAIILRCLTRREFWEGGVCPAIGLALLLLCHAAILLRYRLLKCWTLRAHFTSN